MKKSPELNNERRKLLKWMGGSVVLLSVSGLTACSDGGSESSSLAGKSEPKADPKPQPKAETSPATQPEPSPPAPEQTADTVAQQAAEPAPSQSTAASDSEVPRLAEDNPQAQALGYKTDTNTVDKARYPNHAADQACANCALFAGQAGQEWGPCGIFPGNQVNSGGWCSAYNRKA